LASVNLPGGVQRMRTSEDQLQMRALFQEQDLVSVSCRCMCRRCLYAHTPMELVGIHDVCPS
jgi:hypothetical protein